MSEKKVGKRLLTWVLVLVMTLSLLPLNVLAANPAVMRIVRPDTDKYITYNFYLNEGDKTPYYYPITRRSSRTTNLSTLRPLPRRKTTNLLAGTMVMNSSLISEPQSLSRKVALT